MGNKCKNHRKKSRKVIRATNKKNALQRYIKSPNTCGVSQKRFWIEFIEIYKEHKCLWDRNSEDFHNQTLKSLAQGLLLEKMWEIDATADIDSVKNKIINLRKYYIEAKRKNIDQKTTSLHWFYIPFLDFLSTQDDIVNYSSVETDSNGGDATDTTNTQKKHPNTISVTELEKSLNIDRKKLKYRRKLPTCNVAVEANLLEGNSSSYSHERQDSSKVNEVEKTVVVEVNMDTSQDDDQKVGTSNVNFLGTNSFQEEEDDSSTFAAHLKTKMRTLDPQQRCIAQKLISEVMFYASMNELQITSEIALNKRND